MPNLAGQGTLADVNGDGLSDLITYTQSGNNPPQLMICFGQRDGTFSQAVSAGFTMTNGTPTQVLAGDFNGDGRIDLVFIYGGSYQVLLNNGSGQFTSASTEHFPEVAGAEARSETSTEMASWIS